MDLSWLHRVMIKMMTSKLITESNYNDPNFFVYPGTPVTFFDIELINSTTVGSPHKFFRVNNPIVGGWSGYVNEIVSS